MASNDFNLQYFISQDVGSKYNYTIDGAQAKECQKTNIEGEEIVQLRRASTRECKFDWQNRCVKEVDIKNIMVVDPMDVMCLVWFIKNKTKINFSPSSLSVSSRASTELANQLNLLDEETKVVPGSTITVPLENGLSGMGRTDKISSACERVGFKVSWW
jgi:hypothetical protein